MATSKETPNENKENGMPSWQLAKEGIKLLINNNQQDAEAIFNLYPDDLNLSAGYAYAVVTNALLTFEDEKIHEAFQKLRDLEKKCSSYNGYNSWISSVKSKVFGTEANCSHAEKLESQIILADVLVFFATLTFLQQDISGYFKGGWMLRKSYKQYQSLYTEILGLYNEIVGDDNVPGGSLNSSSTSSTTSKSSEFSTTDNPTNPAAFDTHLNEAEPKRECSIAQISEKKESQTEEVITAANLIEQLALNAISSGNVINENAQVDQNTSEETKLHEHSEETTFEFVETESQRTDMPDDDDDKLKDESVLDPPVPSSSCPRNGKEIDKGTIGRLLCAVSFGYGLLQLGISLLPPSVLKLTSFFGFGGNRKNGLEKLMYSRTGTDMRAPFATLALLWYHTIVRPFFALDGNNVQAGAKIASRLINETKEEFGQSAFFLFFKGRVERLNSDISAATRAFESSIENANQREIKIISMHEVGWCYLITLDHAQSESIFLRLKQSSRWSRPFYAYLAMISAGANNMFQEIKDTSEFRQVFQSVPKGTQLDEFLNRRNSLIPKADNILRETSSLFWKLLIYELLYLWNALPSCTKENILKIIEDCCTASETNAEPMKGLSKLIEGSCHCILKDYENGIYCFQRSVEIRNGLPYNSDTAHVSAFAQYELGLLLIKREKMKLEGKKVLQSISRYKGYDFEQRLSIRVHAVLKTL